MYLTSLEGKSGNHDLNIHGENVSSKMVYCFQFSCFVVLITSCFLFDFSSLGSIGLVALVLNFQMAAEVGIQVVVVVRKN